MVLVAVALMGLVGSFGQDPVPGGGADVAAEYRQAREGAGRGAADQVRLALWCEAHGLSAERVRHLALAVLADPANATARGLLGLVRRDGRWVAPDEVAEATRTDPARAALLAEYDARRAKTPYNADAQWALGLWADEHGLPDQARAHFTVVARLDPAREGAWKRLGYKKHDGGWATDAQVSAARAEAEAQKAADRSWKPKLERWRGQLAQPSKREEAQGALLGVTDPRALPSMLRVFGTKQASDQLVLAGLLGQIEGPAASLALAQLAVAGPSPEVRRVAVETLRRRDPREFVAALVRLVRTPWKYEVRPVNGPGSTGELFVEGERYNIRKLVRPPAFDPNLVPRISLSYTPLNDFPMADLADPNSPLLGAAILSQASINNAAWGRGPAVPGRLDALNATILNYEVAAARQQMQIRRLQQANLNDARLAQQALEQGIREVEATNATIHQANERVLPILATITGQNLGEDSEAWNRWNTEQAGYAFQSSTDEKPTFSEVVPLAYSTGTTPGHHACFAAGTPVRTIDGSRAIETIRRGDQVLVQDTRTGSLSFQPVLTAFHNPPSGTLRVKLGDDEVVATGIHRFWRAGHGWAMVRDLKPGDSLRVLGGVATVAGVEPVGTQPVFNLEVAEGRSFFVGRLGALVHDNSLVEPTPEPFDAPAAPGEAPAATRAAAAR